MPSIRSLLTGLTWSTITLLQLTSATPIPTSDDCPSPVKPTISTPSSKTPVLPSNGGATELPAPTSSLTYVTIGRGIQNYTCASPSALPVAIGAIATLYDVTALAKVSTSLVHLIPAKAVYLNLPSSQSKALKFPSPIGDIKPLGHHYFDAAGVPVFELSTAASKTKLFGAKQLGIKAPATADKGPAKTGAVDWLYLTATTKEGYTSLGASSVYRVVTAGGVARPCSEVWDGNAAKVQSVQYATEYWFYK